MATGSRRRALLERHEHRILDQAFVLVLVGHQAAHPADLGGARFPAFSQATPGPRRGLGSSPEHVRSSVLG